MWIVTRILRSMILSSLLAFTAVSASQSPAEEKLTFAAHNKAKAPAPLGVVGELSHQRKKEAHNKTKAPLEDPEFLKKEFLESHNKARGSLGVPPLTWDQKLAHYSLEWGKNRTNDCKMIHSNGPYGENLFWSLNSRWTPSMAVDSWVDESKDYNRKTNSCASGKKCGHFTQVMWKSTARVGCAHVKCLNHTGYLSICSYDPPGNYEGEGPFDHKKS